MDNPRRVRIGFLGLGHRGPGLLSLLLDMGDVDIVAVCDRYDDRVRAAQDTVREKRGTEAAGYADHRALLARGDIDGVVVATSWTTHIRVAVDAMRAGKHVAMEVGGASSLDECWQLVRVSEETGRFCMLLENCCYGRAEMALLNMVRRGLFGELIHMQGAYGHDLRSEIVQGIENRHYRHNNFANRNGELYPTHELGPIAELLRLNRGNRMVSLTSMSSKSRGLREWAAAHGYPDEAARPWTQGDVVTTLIRCAHGETIVLSHETSLPRPYSRGLRVQGTRGIYMEDGNQISLEGVTPPPPPERAWMEHDWEPFGPYLEKYDHPLWKWFTSVGVRGGHGGMDYLVQRAFIESLQTGRTPPIDVYDTAAWMSVTCLSEQSVALGGMPVAVPDFTNGAWIDRGPDPVCRWSLDEVRPELF